MSLRRRLAVTGAAAILLTGIGVAQGRGIIWHNALFTVGHDVRGLDVSHHQGHIDWSALKGWDFVYIKATEGRTWTDPLFEENWLGAGQAGLVRGAYHFLVTTSTGQAQGEHLPSGCGTSSRPPGSIGGCGSMATPGSPGSARSWIRT